MSVTLRRYGPADLEACRALWRELTQHHRDIYGDQEIGGDDPGLEFDEHLQKPHLVATWVAEDGDGIVGLCGLLVNGEGGEVDPMVVHATRRSQGVGGEMLRAAVEEAKRRGVRFLSVRPVARNERAIDFYHEAGFRTLGHLDMFIELSDGDGREWRPGITIHGRDFRC